MAESIHQEIVLNANPSRIYDAYMDSKQHDAFTGGEHTEIGSNEGDTFSCHGGMISGRNIELIPDKRIVQAWRVANWEQGRYSIVAINIEPVAEGTKLTLDHTGFPDGEAEHLSGGWHARYWEPLKEYLG